MELPATGVNRGCNLAASACGAQERSFDLLSRLFAAAGFPGPAALAAKLLTELGSLGRLFSLSPEAITQAVDGDTAVPALISVMAETLTHVLAVPIENEPLISNQAALQAYLRLGLAHATVERCRVLFLDTKNRLIRDETIATGSIDTAFVYPRQIVRRALELDAAGLILVHNHPSGDPTPSQHDKRLTADVAHAARAVELTLHDHVIVARTGCTSLRALGWL